MGQGLRMMVRFLMSNSAGGLLVDSELLGLWVAG